MSWQTVQITEVARVVGGATPKSQVENYWGGNIRWATPKDLSDLQSQYISETPRTITEAGLKSCATEVMPEGTVLFSSRAPIGHIAITKRPMATNQGFKSFVPGPRLDAGFLYWWLDANREKLQALGTGATFKEVSKATVQRIEIPLPPLEEQKRIARILDQAAELCRLRTRALDKLNTLGQAIFHEMFGDPVANVKGLASVPLGDVATFQSGGTPSKDEERYWGGHIPWVTPKDMKRTWLKGAQDHVTEEALSTTSLKSVMAGTPLVVVRGMILAHTVPLAISEVDCTINQDMKAIHFDQRVDPVFGLFNLKCQHGSLLTRVSTAAHGTKRFDLSELRKAPVLLPGLDEQQRFVQALENTRAIRSCASAEAAQQEALFASLQHRAFKGEL